MTRADSEHEKYLELLTTGMASGGDAVARDPEGKAVFVRGALPGQRVRVRLVADHARYAIGSIDELVEPSPDRIVPPCPEVDRGCGACQWQYVSIAMQRRLKLQFIVDAIERSGVQCPEPNPSVELAPWALHTTVKAAVTDRRAGYLRPRSHQMVPVDSCQIAHPLLVDLLVVARYPGAHPVLLRCGDRTGERLAATTPSGLSLSLPGDVQTDHLHERVAERSWRVSTRSFFQSRPDGADALAGWSHRRPSDWRPPPRPQPISTAASVSLRGYSRLKRMVRHRRRGLTERRRRRYVQFAGLGCVRRAR